MVVLSVFVMNDCYILLFYVIIKIHVIKLPLHIRLCIWQIINMKTDKNGNQNYKG